MSRKKALREFYVGYQGKAPEYLSRFVRKRLRIALGLIGLALLATVLGSSRFGRGKFEWKTEREFTGVLSTEPVPSLLVLRPGVTGDAPRFSRYALVNQGKFGVAESLSPDLEGQAVNLRGKLIFRDEQTLIEVDPGQLKATPARPADLPVEQPLGHFIFRGEIVDSKCYLGVMKPGNLKTHRACAIRCISGGVPPVLLVRDSLDRAVYLFIVGPEGEAINREILPLVGLPVEMEGEVERHSSQLVLKVKPEEIRRL